MRTLFFSALMAVVFTVMCNGVLRADLRPDEIVAYFNSLSPGNNGFQFSSSLPGTGERRFSGSGGYNYTNLATAYMSGTNGTSVAVNSFTSFCIEPNVSNIAASGLARLNYANNSTRTDSDGKAVSIGTALLYKMYATGGFETSLFDYGNTAQRTQDTSLLTQTLRYLMAPQSEPPLNWVTNKYLAELLRIKPDQSYWLEVYDPYQRYDEIGNYVVFVMNILATNGTGQYQDFLYIANADYGGGNSGVPEPATFLFWAFGGLGLVCTSRARYRRMKKLALA